MNKILSNNWTYEGVEYTFSWYPDLDLTGLKNVNQAYGFCYNEDNELLVIETSIPGKWQVPGGTIEVGEKPEETLARELDEETNVAIKDIIYLGSQKVTNSQDAEIIYQTRFACRLLRENPRKPDPDNGEIRDIQFIDPYEFNDMAGWGPIGDELIRLSMEKLNISR